MQKINSKRLQYRDLKPVIREKFKQYLFDKEQNEGLKLPDEYQGKYSFEAYSEPGNDSFFLFNLMILGERPEDAIMILEANVSRIDGTVKDWRCYDDAFVKTF